MVVAPEKRVAFRCSHGKFLSATPDGRLEAKAETVGPAESFLLIPLDGMLDAGKSRYNIKSSFGKYVTATDKHEALADRVKAWGWEKIKIVMSQG